MPTTWWIEQQRIQSIVRERDELAVRVAELEGENAALRFVLDQSQRCEVIEIVEMGEEEPVAAIFYRWDPTSLSWLSYRVENTRT